MEAPVVPVAGLISAALALLLLRAGPGRAGICLALFLLAEALHGWAHGLAAGGGFLADGAVAQALRFPLLAGFVLLGGFVSDLTGLHRRAWRHPATVAAALALPAGLTWTEAGRELGAAMAAAVPAGTGLGLASLAFEAYLATLLAISLAREGEAAAVPVRSLVLAFFLIRQVPVAALVLAGPAASTWQTLLGLPLPALVPPLATAVLVSSLPALLLRGASHRAREAVVSVAALAALASAAALVAPGVAAAGPHLRLLFAAVVMGYALIRHGLPGVAPLLPARIGLPLLGIGFALHFAALAVALEGRLPDWAALAASMGVTLLSAALLLALSGVTMRSAAQAWERLAAAFRPGRDAGLVAGRYRLVALLGEGAAASTYEAVDEDEGTRVVLKLVWKRSGQDAAAVRREAAAIARVRHPNVIRLHRLEETPEGLCLVLDLAEGGTLARRLQRGPLAQAEFRAVAVGLLRALSAVHKAGLVHRDVKPGNVLLAADGTPWLADFHVASVPALDGSAVAAGGAPVGTLRYMSPEAAQGRPATPRSDLYSAGVTLYEACTGEAFVKARPGESREELRLRVARPDPFHRDRPPPGDLREWFARALAPRAEDRFRDAEEMMEALDAAVAALAIAGTE